MKSFAGGMDRTTIIGFCDTTVASSGKNGYIFTDTKVYYLDTFDKPRKLWYDDIKSIELTKTDQKKDYNKELTFNLYDGSVILWNSTFLNKTPLYEFFEELLKMVRDDEEYDLRLKYEQKRLSGAFSGGIAVGSYDTTNKLYEGVSS